MMGARSRPGGGAEGVAPVAGEAGGAEGVGYGRVAVSDQQGCLENQGQVFGYSAGSVFDGCRVCEGVLGLADGLVEVAVGACG